MSNNPCDEKPFGFDWKLGYKKLEKEIERLKSTLDEQAEFHKEELNQCQENFDAKHKIIKNALKEFTVMDWNTTIKCTLFHLYELLGGKP